MIVIRHSHHRLTRHGCAIRFCAMHIDMTRMKPGSRISQFFFRAPRRAPHRASPRSIASRSRTVSRRAVLRAAWGADGRARRLRSTTPILPFIYKGNIGVVGRCGVRDDREVARDTRRRGVETHVHRRKKTVVTPARSRSVRRKKNFKIAKKYLPFSYLSVTQSVEKKLNQQNIRRASRPTAQEVRRQSAHGPHEIDGDAVHNGAFVQEAARVTAARLVP